RRVGRRPLAARARSRAWCRLRRLRQLGGQRRVSRRPTPGRPQPAARAAATDAAGRRPAGAGRVLHRHLSAPRRRHDDRHGQGRARGHDQTDRVGARDLDQRQRDRGALPADRARDARSQERRRRRGCPAGLCRRRGGRSPVVPVRRGAPVPAGGRGIRVNTFDAYGYTARLHELAAAYDVPGAVVGVFAGEQTATTATGVLNRLTGVDASTDSLFQIGSITKVWTAALILTLVDEGRLSLTDPVIRHVPELTLVDERSTRELTVGHLLNHTSGLPGDWFPDTGRGDDCLARLVTLLADQPLTHPVGGLTSYSNAAFSLAGHVVERMLDVTWDDALRDRIIKPLGLEHCVTLPEDALLHRTAVGHLDRGSAQQPAPMWQ